MRHTGCRGVMIGRAALSDPWIFRDTHAYLTTGVIPEPPSPAERITLMETHFHHLRRISGDRIACAIFRQRVSWYAKKLPPCRGFLQRMREMKNPDDFPGNIAFLHEEIEKGRSIRVQV